MSRSSEQSRAASVWAAAIVAVLLLCLPAIYFGAYALLLLPDMRVNLTDAGLSVAPRYRIQHPLVEFFFLPANWSDRRVRPERWEASMSDISIFMQSSSFAPQNATFAA